MLKKSLLLATKWPTLPSKQYLDPLLMEVSGAGWLENIFDGNCRLGAAISATLQRGGS
jgi:hypothetical protein